MRARAAGIDLLNANLRSALIVVALRAASLVPVLAITFITLPGPEPSPVAQSVSQLASSVLATPLPTPSLPVPVHVSPPPVAVLASPTPVATRAPAGSGGGAARQGSGSGAAPATGQSSGGPVLPIPFTSIVVSGPLDIALLVTLAVLPLLLGIWMLVFGRTLREARRAREAHVRLMLAADLGLKPRELTGMSARTLFRLREKAAFDELTGVLRRAAGVSAAEREIARARRHGTPLSIAFVDIDGLKQANDKHGHQAGDRMLRALSAALKAGLRSQDVVFRYGGDEFVCLLPETTVRSAREKLGSVRDELARQGIRFCAGVAELARGDDVVELFARADRDLYDFKANRGEIVQLPPAGAVKRGRGKRVTA